jgi:SpoVK/Ycf46/Vps4 family AAA+-type ATPase
MIGQAFARIEELASFFGMVIVLFDEVESLITNRALSLNENNPVDVFRSVNTVFQHIDTLATLKNVFIVATSNLTKAIDQAFLDRSDVSFFVGLPDTDARHLILQDILEELTEKLNVAIEIPAAPPVHDWHPWAILLQETEGFSGRQLRKLVAEALTFNPEVARKPSLLQLDHILAAAQHNRQRLQRDAVTDGVHQSAFEGLHSGRE